jgi:hypothetical protein
MRDDRPPVPITVSRERIAMKIREHQQGQLAAAEFQRQLAVKPATDTNQAITRTGRTFISSAPLGGHRKP